MTRVTSGTQIIKRHHMMTPIEHGCLGDLEDLVAMAQSATGSRFDDAARIIPDDENIHVTWEEVVDENYQSELEDFQRWLTVRWSDTTDYEGMKAMVETIKVYQAHKANKG